MQIMLYFWQNVIFISVVYIILRGCEHEYTQKNPVIPLDREEIWRLYGTRDWTVVALAQRFRVSRPTIYKAIERARKQEFSPRKSTNKRFLQAKYGMKRLAKVESSLEIKKKLAARRYHKSYPGEMVHFDTKRLPCSRVRSKLCREITCL